MLAQYFKTAADLHVRDAEFEAAIEVLGMLERGELKNHFCNQNHQYQPKIPNGFDMDCSGEVTDCGTVACIGGWMGIVMKLDPSDYVHNKASHALLQLFWEQTDSAISTEQAGIALRNFLTFGEPRWNEALEITY